MRSALTLERLECRDLPAVAFASLPVLPFSDPAVLDNARAIFAHGEQLGRNPDTFARFGDSNSSTYPAYGGTPSPYLNPLGAPQYNPAATNLAESHPELLATWQVYHNTLNNVGENSFSWFGPGAHAGFTTPNVLAALGADIARSDPSVALIMIGTVELFNPDTVGYKTRLTQIVDTLISQGVVPILSTIPPLQYGGGAFANEVPVFNQIIANVAARERVPLWNFWRDCVNLPDEGIYQDSLKIHLTISPNGGGSFFPSDLQYAQNLRNLEALQILNWFRTSVESGPTYIAPNASWQAMPTSSNLYAVGRDVGFSPTVDVYDAATSAPVNRFLAFGSSFDGGVRVATGDVNGDGFTDVICATGAGTTGRVKVFSGKDGSLLASFTPFAGYTGGLSVAVGELDGDGVDDIVVGKATGSSGIRVYEGGTFALTSEFRGFPQVSGGVSVAVANVAGIGQVIAAGSSASPTVRLFDVDGSLVSSFAGFGGSGFGITVAAADLDDDGSDEIAVARTTGSNQVRILNATAHTLLATFTVGPVSDSSFGIRLGVLRKASGSDMLLVGNGPGSAVSLDGFNDLSGNAMSLPPANANRAYGIFVG